MVVVVVVKGGLDGGNAVEFVGWLVVWERLVWLLEWIDCGWFNPVL